MEVQFKTNIKAWAEDDRPREKLKLKGVQTLSDAELLAILIRSGNRKETALDLAKKLLQDKNNSIAAISRLDYKEIMLSKLGEVASLTIAAALELGRRRQSDAYEMPTIKSHLDAAKILQPMIGDLPYEECCLLILNRACKLVKKVRLFKGGIAGTVVDPKLVAKECILSDAHGMIIAHNHPAGNLTPSDNDIKITKQIKSAMQSIGVNFLDHIIITSKGYYSIEEGTAGTI